MVLGLLNTWHTFAYELEAVELHQSAFSAASGLIILAAATDTGVFTE